VRSCLVRGQVSECEKLPGQGTKEECNLSSETHPTTRLPFGTRQHGPLQSSVFSGLHAKLWLHEHQKGRASLSPSLWPAALAALSESHLLVGTSLPQLPQVLTVTHQLPPATAIQNYPASALPMRPGLLLPLYHGLFVSLEVTSVHSPETRPCFPRCLSGGKGWQLS
jgi:hypothetical protein